MYKYIILLAPKGKFLRFERRDKYLASGQRIKSGSYFFDADNYFQEGTIFTLVNILDNTSIHHACYGDGVWIQVYPAYVMGPKLTEHMIHQIKKNGQTTYI